MLRGICIIKRIFFSFSFRSIQSGRSVCCAWKLEPGFSSQVNVSELCKRFVLCKKYNKVIVYFYFIVRIIRQLWKKALRLRQKSWRLICRQWHPWKELFNCKVTLLKPAQRSRSLHTLIILVQTWWCAMEHLMVCVFHHFSAFNRFI